MQKTKMKVVLTTLMLLLSIAMLAIPAAASGEATITRTVTPTEVFPGDDYTVTLTVTYGVDADFIAIHEDLPEDWILNEMDSGRYSWSPSNEDYAWFDMGTTDLTGVTDIITYNVTVPEGAAFNTYDYGLSNLTGDYIWSVETTGDTQVNVVHNSVIELYPGDDVNGAISSAQPGDTVLLNDGTYGGFTVASDYVTIKSKNGSDAVNIAGTIQIGTTGMIPVPATGNIIDGLAISGSSYGAIWIVEGPGTVIRNCTFVTAGACAIDSFARFPEENPIQVYQCNLNLPLTYSWAIENLVLNTTEPVSYTYNGVTYTGYVGNYYADCAGTDNDGDGVIDTPHAIEGRNATGELIIVYDNYPLAGTWHEGEIHPVPPTADFAANTTYIPQDMTVQFTDLSANDPESWSWDLDGDGIEDSTEQNPQFTYTDEGTYNVSLTVSNTLGNDAETKVDYILVRNSKTWYVDDDGGYDFTSIQDALNVALPEDEIYVYNGTYGEFYFANPSVTVRGEGADVVTVDCNGGSVQIGYAGCTLEGIKVVNSNYGLRLSSPNCIIRNCVFDGMTDMEGIELHGDHCLFENNIVSNSTGDYCALYINNANSIFVDDNTFINNAGAGLSLYSGAEGTIVSNNNFVSNGWAGIEFYDAVGANTIYGNNFIGNGVTATTTGTTPPAVTNWNSTEPMEYSYNGVTYTGYLGNFWDSAYTGSDSDANGIGDTSYTVPDSLGTDYAPLIGAWDAATATIEVKPYVLSFVPGDASVIKGQETQIQIMVSALPEGLSGYNLTVNIVNPTVAEIVDIEYPTWASITENSSMPGTSIYLKAVDGGSAVQAGDEDVVLATLTVSGNDFGSTGLILSLSDEGMDDDSGYPIDVILSTGALEVTMTPIPGETLSPQDVDGDGLYEDLTGNGEFGFVDVVAFFNDMEWIEANMPLECSDFNGNGRIDFDDVVKLFEMVGNPEQ